MGERQQDLRPSLGGEGRLPGIGELVAGKYRVERFLGVGGMGTVLSARHEQLGQVVALKVLHPQSRDEPESVSRFMREAQLAASLESDHVVRTFDVGTLDDGVPFLVMERLFGEDLGRVLERHGKLVVPHAVECVYQAALGVVDAHAAGVIHRDLKPSNLYLTRRRDGTACVKVLDFGISKALVEGGVDGEVQLTRTRNVVGSPLYMSPEQVRDSKQVDPRSDVWSLGVILYQLLSGRPPFDGETMPAVCARIAADPPPPVDRDDAPPELLAVLDRCLQKDPALRFGSALELCAALRPFRPEGPLSFALLSDEALALRDSGPRPSRPPGALEFQPADGARDPPPGDGAALSLPAEGLAPAAALHPPSGRHPSDSVTRTLAAPQETAPGRRRAAVVAALLLVAGASSGLWFVAASRSPAASKDAAVSGSPSGSPAKEPPPGSAPGERAPAALVTLRVDSVPAGAEVWEGDRVRGRTPLDVQVPRGAPPPRLRLQLEGHAPFALEEPPLERDRELRVQLIPATPAASGAVDPVVDPVVESGAPAAPPKGTVTGPATAAPRPPPPPRPSAAPRPAPRPTSGATASPTRQPPRNDDPGIRTQR
ncbi:MAG: protein kinase [Myxococcales bacterium]|nr:protein kinase [Myxococcales bacterium]